MPEGLHHEKPDGKAAEAITLLLAAFLYEQLFICVLTCMICKGIIRVK